MMDVKTFESAIEANKGAIFRICRIYARSPLQPEDLFQEIVFEVWKSRKRFRGEAAVSTWIYRIALNVGMRSRARLEREQAKNVRLDAVHFLHAETVDVAQEEKFAALRACIAALDEADRSLVVLYLEELPYREIAEVMGISENHVAVKMRRIRKKLLHCITPKLKHHD